MSLNLTSEKMIEVRYLAEADACHDSIEEDLASIGYVVVHSGESRNKNGSEYVSLVAIKDFAE